MSDKHRIYIVRMNICNSRSLV